MYALTRESIPANKARWFAGGVHVCISAIQMVGNVLMHSKTTGNGDALTISTKIHQR
jgi:hypothetical protein